MSSLAYRAGAWGARRLRQRLQAVKPPSLRHQGPGQRHTYYLCPDHNRPSGGVRAIYRHVDILNNAGREASVLHKRRGFACSWFSHDTRVAWAPDVVVGSSDIVVVPEIYAGSVDSLPAETRLVCFNQNAYLTFAGEPAASERHYDRFDATMVVSEDNRRYLSFAFPRSRVQVVPNSIDTSVFFPSDHLPCRRISVMPHKREADWRQVDQLVRHRLPAGWEVDVIRGASETETARRLRSSSVFVALGQQEGFGLPVAEALASGCRVVGFHGYGGQELFRPEFADAVEDGDVVGLAEQIVQVTMTLERDRDAFVESGRAAAKWIASSYTPDRQARDLLCFFEAADD